MAASMGRTNICQFVKRVLSVSSRDRFSDILQRHLDSARICDNVCKLATSSAIDVFERQEQGLNKSFQRLNIRHYSSSTNNNTEGSSTNDNTAGSSSSNGNGDSDKNDNTVDKFDLKQNRTLDETVSVKDTQETQSAESAVEEQDSISDRLIGSDSATVIQAISSEENNETELSDSVDNNETELLDAVDYNETKLSDTVDNKETELSDSVDNNETKLSDSVDANETELFDTVDNNETKLFDTVDDNVTKLFDSVDDNEAELLDTVEVPGAAVEKIVLDGSDLSEGFHEYTEMEKKLVQFEEVHDDLYLKIDLTVKSIDREVLRSYLKFLQMAALGFQIKFTTKRMPKYRVTRSSILKSVHVYKKHYRQYEIRTHLLYCSIHKVTGSTASVFLEYIQRNLPEGMAMKVTKHKIEMFPEHLKPKIKTVEKIQNQES